MQRNVEMKKGNRLWQSLVLSARREALEKALWHIVAALMGGFAASAELLFGVRPFGIALASAASALYLPAVAGGAALYCLLTVDFVHLLAVAAVIPVRLALTYYLEAPQRGRKRAYVSPRPALCMIAAGVAAMGVGIWAAVRGGYRYYDLFGLLLALAAAPLATFLYGFLFEGEESFAHARELGAAALGMTLIFALREVEIFGIYPAAVAAILASLMLTSRYDIRFGVSAGLLAGLCFDWRMAPAFLLTAPVFTLLAKSSRGGGVLLGGAASLGAAYLMEKTAGVSVMLPALLAAGALFLAIDSAGLMEASPARRVLLARRRHTACAVRTGQLGAVEGQMQALSGAFLDLSSTFFELSHFMRRPGLLDLRHLCDRTFDKVCPGCPYRDTCWGSEYSETTRAVASLGNHLRAHGSARASLLTQSMQARCTALPQILSDINNGCAQMTEELLRGDKMAVVATDYAAMGRLLQEVSAAGEAYFQNDLTLSARIYDHLVRMGYALECAAVCGTTHRRVLLRGLRLPGRHLQVRDLREQLEKCCKFPLGQPTVTTDETVSDMTFPERGAIETSIFKLTRTKGRADGRRCGDSVVSFSTEGGFDYSFLCDGMGSGHAAALTSTLASTYLSKMLQAGVRPETALKMLNGFMSERSKGESEASTTVDLLEIDRVSCEAAVFKCGAAPTFLLRGGNVTHLCSRTAPLGILETLDAERISFSVMPDDVLVQVSDGICEGEDSSPWLSHLLATGWQGSAEKLARLILNRATEEGSTDDLSVIVCEIKSAQTPAEGI